MTSPALAARQTAQDLGLTASSDTRLGDMDAGQWTGLSFEQAQAQDPEGFAVWLAAPDQGVPGGESLAATRTRVKHWLDERVGQDRRIIVITHPMVIRAALSACLDLPLISVMRFDIAPLSTTLLSHNRVWRLQTMGRH